MLAVFRAIFNAGENSPVAVSPDTVSPEAVSIDVLIPTAADLLKQFHRC